MNLSRDLDRWLPPGARELLRRIGSCAGDLGVQTYLVGGPVRDLILGRQSFDLDVVVQSDAPAVAHAATLPDEPPPVVHPFFGTATLYQGAFRADLATARAEIYERPGALPIVRWGSIEQDLARRDFTVNAMALTLGGPRHGDLLDLHGGRSDLEHGLLRVLHDASFVDDATRILRGVRYEQRFGFAFEKLTLEALQRDLRYLDCLSPDRVRHEFERTFAEDEPEQALRRLNTLNVFSAIHPGLVFGPEKAWILEGFRRRALPPSQLYTVYWCLLAWGLSSMEVETFATRLCLPRRIQDAIADAVALQELAPYLDDPGLTPGQVFEVLHGRSVAALIVAERLFVRPFARSSLSLYLHRLRHVRLSLTGRDLQALGIPEGVLLGRILSCLRTARLNGEVSSREEEAALALRLLNDA